MKSFEKLPSAFQCGEVRPYYDILSKKTAGRIAKRVFDIVVSLVHAAFLY